MKGDDLATIVFTLIIDYRISIPVTAEDELDICPVWRTATSTENARGHVRHLVCIFLYFRPIFRISDLNYKFSSRLITCEVPSLGILSRFGGCSLVHHQFLNC